MDRSGKGGVVSDGAIVGATGHVERPLGAVVTAVDTGPRGGVCSAGDLLDAAVGDRSRECNAIEFHQGTDIGHDYEIGFPDLGKGDSELVCGWVIRLWFQRWWWACWDITRKN
ncbi:hypothetical protein V6N11_056917 [Hibiscus sabdariffa]|uniref:Uncharacterized protein n=1 Tax=Hibiscus sabdariffa TaxID=183260 RepID=A0ABR2T5U9_9ROSI